MARLNPKFLIGLLVALVMLGGTASTIFSGVNSTNLAGTPSWFITTAPIVVAGVIIMWLVGAMGK